jgi:predicted component of type VI protein secretion system
VEELRERYGYSPTQDTGRRRRNLKKAIRRLNYDYVIDRLQEYVDSHTGYRAERARQDLNHFIQKQELFLTEKQEYQRV